MAAPIYEEQATNEIIKLNVGGHKFTTTRTTLCSIPDSFFVSMFRHPGPPALQDEDGYFFIDRDGTQFQHVLNYLRSGTVIATLDSAARAQLADDAEYYWLDGLKHNLLRPKVDIREHLSDDILSIQDEEESLRSKFASREAGGLSEYESLIPLFDLDHGVQPLPLTFRPREDMLNAYMSRIHEQACSGTTVTVGSLEEFRANFRSQHDREILEHLETILMEEHVIIAGGSVLRALMTFNGSRTSRHWNGDSDIDLFLYGCTAEDANRIAERIFRAISVNQEPWVIVRCSGVINIHLQELDAERRYAIDETCQIVLRLYDSPAEVLLGFDVDCCCCLYNGRDVWVSRRCLMALETGTNVLNPLHSWPNKASYEVRLAKYALRGFAVVVPGLDESLIDYNRIHDQDLDALKGLARFLKVSFVHYSDGIPETGPCYDSSSAMKTAIIPSIYEERIGIDGRDMLQRVRRSFAQEKDYRCMFRFDMFFISPGTTNDAWEEIVDGGTNVPAELPRRLLDAWVTKKRSREYMNAQMDKLDLDNTYYSEVYKSGE